MRIHIVQKDIKDTDYSGHLEAVLKQQVDLVCFGELSTSGCLYRPREVDSLETIVKSFEKYNFGILLGFPYQTDEGLFNSCLYYKNGAYQIYSKIRLFEPMNEHLTYKPGRQLGLFETDFGKVGVAICYDLRFPDIFSSLKKAGAWVIFVPAAFPRVRIADWRELLVERARDNNVYVIGINAVGNDGVNEFGGTSMVIDPWGRVLTRASEEHEEVLRIDLELHK